MRFQRTFGLSSRSVTLVLLAPLLVALSGCNSRIAPNVEHVEQVLSVDYPESVKIIGGESKPKTFKTVLLIASDEPLPLPVDDQNTKQRPTALKRPIGTEFPVSALANLTAAYGIALNDVPKFTKELGRCHDGEVGDYQFSYREAATEKGWLTAVEVFRIRNLEVQNAEQ